jgi:acyl carrier protein
MTADTFQVLTEILRRHSAELRERGLEPEGELAALGIDSLELLSVAVDIEDALDIDIDDAELGSARTVADLLEVITTAQS